MEEGLLRRLRGWEVSRARQLGREVAEVFAVLVGALVGIAAIGAVGRNIGVVGRMMADPQAGSASGVHSEHIVVVDKIAYMTVDGMGLLVD